jgi:hypothetical protein
VAQGLIGKATHVGFVEEDEAQGRAFTSTAVFPYQYYSPDIPYSLIPILHFDIIFGISGISK